MENINTRAAVRERYCSGKELQVLSVPAPSLRFEDLLVRVHATTVNRTDCAVLTGKPFIMRFFIGLFRPKISITGTDFAGEILATGEPEQLDQH